MVVDVIVTLDARSRSSRVPIRCSGFHFLTLPRAALMG
jgi:hypothetical protein